MVVNVHILYLFSHCVSFALLIIDFIVILHVRLIRVLLKINIQSINQSITPGINNQQDLAFVHAVQRRYCCKDRQENLYSESSNSAKAPALCHVTVGV